MPAPEPLTAGATAERRALFLLLGAAGLAAFGAGILALRAAQRAQRPHVSSAEQSSTTAGAQLATTSSGHLECQPEPAEDEAHSVRSSSVQTRCWEWLRSSEASSSSPAAASSPATGTPTSQRPVVSPFASAEVRSRAASQPGRLLIQLGDPISVPGTDAASCTQLKCHSAAWSEPAGCSTPAQAERFSSSTRQPSSPRSRGWQPDSTSAASMRSLKSKSVPFGTLFPLRTGSRSGGSSAGWGAVLPGVSTDAASTCSQQPAAAPAAAVAAVGGPTNLLPACSAPAVLQHAMQPFPTSSQRPATKFASAQPPQPTVAVRAQTVPPVPQCDASVSTQAAAAASPDIKGTVQLHELQLYHHPDGTPYLLGKGTFGQVYKARFGSEEVAVKVFAVGMEARGEADFRKEIQLLQVLENAHIVGFRGACLDAPGHLMLIMEWMANGDLRSALSTNASSANLRWYTRLRGDEAPQPGMAKQIALDIARGLQFLHSRHIVHLDVKSPNILLTADNRAKIGDVGMAHLLKNDYLSAEAAIGTFSWAAPEVLMGQKCGVQSDIYAFGVILWELVTGEQPVRGRMRPIRVPEECPQGVSDLVAMCMSHKASARPTATDIVGLLSGDPRVLEAPRPPPRFCDANTADGPEPPVLTDDRVWLQRYYTECNTSLYGSLEAAVAAGYTEPPIESVVEGIRPFDGKSYSDLVDIWRQLLQSPDVDDLASASRCRLEELVAVFLPVYTLKLKLGTRFFQEARFLDVHELGKLMGSLPPETARGVTEALTDGRSTVGDMMQQRQCAHDAAPAATDDPAAGSVNGSREAAAAGVRSSAAAHAGVSPPAGYYGSSGSSGSLAAHNALHRRSASGSSSVMTAGQDEYDTDRSAAHRPPPSSEKWRRVLEEMGLGAMQRASFMEARKKVGQRFAELRAQRRKLVAALRSLAEGSAHADYDAAVSASTALRENMMLESRALHNFHIWTISELLAPIQYVRAEVAAWPAVLDSVAVGDLLVAAGVESAAAGSGTLAKGKAATLPLPTAELERLSPVEEGSMPEERAKSSDSMLQTAATIEIDGIPAATTLIASLNLSATQEGGTAAEGSDFEKQEAALQAADSRRVTQ